MSTSAIPLWGRAYKLTVGLADSSTVVLTQNSWEPEALRVTFDILQNSYAQPWWFADIKVYNLTDSNMVNLLFNATWLTLEAGYQNGSNKAAVIWDGPVLQVLFNRESVIDMVMEFNCVAGIADITSQFVNIAQGPQTSQYNLVAKMIQQTGGVPGQQLSQKAQALMGAIQYPRGKTTFGSGMKFIQDAADGNYLATWTAGNKNYVTELADPSVALSTDYTYGPPLPPGYSASGIASNTTRSIIGVPKGTPFGCIFTVLLDPRLTVQLPPIVVEFDMTVISQQFIQYPQTLPPVPLTGQFVVASIHHTGDTRGNGWYTEVNAFSRGFASNLLEGITSAWAQGAVPGATP